MRTAGPGATDVPFGQGDACAVLNSRRARPGREFGRPAEHDRDDGGVAAIRRAAAVSTGEATPVDLCAADGGPQRIQIDPDHDGHRLRADHTGAVAPPRLRNTSTGGIGSLDARRCGSPRPRRTPRSGQHPCRPTSVTLRRRCSGCNLGRGRSGRVVEADSTNDRPSTSRT